MKQKRMQRYLALALSLLITFGVVAGIVYADDPARFQAQRQRFNWIVTRRLNVENKTILDGDLDVAGAVAFAGNLSTVGNLTVQGDSNLYGDITSSEYSITMTDEVFIQGSRDAVTGYEYFLTVDGDITGQPSGAKTHAVFIDVERPATHPITVTPADIDDSGLKLRIETNATTTVTSTVLTGADIQAKTDNNAHQGVLRGVQATADTDTGSTTWSALALRAYIEGEGLITDTMQIADFELSRKQTTDPEHEWGLNIRNTSTSGGGADAALRVESSYGAGGSADDDNWDYVIDLLPADAALGDIRLSQGEMIDNLVDGTIRATGHLSVTGDLDVDDIFGMAVFSTTLTGTQTFTPTKSMIVGNPANADLSMTLETASAQNGDMLHIVNIHATNCITIVDPGATAGGSDRRLDKNDSIGFIYVDPMWVEAFFSDNS